jgi:hypothetical protein
MSSRTFISAGWKGFSEENGLNKKEPMEEFDWMDSDYNRSYYSDCKAALDNVEGSREWLKSYTHNDIGLPFNDNMARKVTKLMHNGHSGSSLSSLLWSYKYLLNNWDDFVFKNKTEAIKKVYFEKQIEWTEIEQIYRECCYHEEKKDSADYPDDMDKTILAHSTRFGIPGSISEVKTILDPIVKELEVFRQEHRNERDDKAHRDLMESIEFLYKHPIRWFDTPSGCTLLPRHPSYITKRAIVEMEKKFPGYEKHIENVLVAMGSPKKPAYNDHSLGGIFSNSGQKVWLEFLRQQRVIV